jgi:hypothetical protein
MGVNEAIRLRIPCIEVRSEGRLAPSSIERRTAPLTEKGMPLNSLWDLRSMRIFWESISNDLSSARATEFFEG